MGQPLSEQLLQKDLESRTWNGWDGWGIALEPQGQQRHGDSSGRIPLRFDSMSQTAAFRLFPHIPVLWFTVPI